ncbi:DUF3147 family protein [Bradyrhizobium sp. KB893862 SZCCT0404]|uniref:DUF3147 family protein n=1 Tax=Bradyrhizobium sp. KB893862 SZCCT0404 TaxID=2807672 RepID=UPI001BA63B7E|nr:DUF3147 family protein [Bradyrhizobium sp. KB893862 SZCCT0404]MBR1179403.1 DUF3147 family protein [Bradyrhizobium sp. KB893862 SZCCT0404]
MLVQMSPSALKQTRWYEYGIRFVLGGLATVLAGAMGARFGTAVGGLFLALPAIFCASATLIESHERRGKEKAGLDGRRRGREAAALDAAGAALGSAGLVAFAAVFYVTVSVNSAAAFAVAILAWAVVSVSAWWSRRKFRTVSHRRSSNSWRSAHRRSVP